MEVAERTEVESTGHLMAATCDLWQDARDHLSGLARQAAADVSAIMGGIGSSSSRLLLVGSRSASIECAGPVDAVVAFWVLADAPDAGAVVRSAAGALRSGGRLLLVEPDLLEKESALGPAVEFACRSGMRLVREPRVTLSRAALLVRE